MICPNRKKKMNDTTCSYCNYRLTEIDINIDNNKDEEKNFKKYNLIYILLVILGIILSIVSSVFAWFIIVSVLVLSLLLYLLIKKLFTFSVVGKNKKVYYISLFVLVTLFTLFPAITSISHEINMVTCSKNYNEMIGINLPDRRPNDYDYYDNHTSGYKNEVYIYEMNEQELTELKQSGVFNEVSTTDSMYNIFYNLIGRKYEEKYTAYLVYDRLGNKFDHIDDLYIYHNVVIVISEDNTVYLCDMFKAEPNSKE